MVRHIALALGCLLLPLAAGCKGTVIGGGGGGGGTTSTTSNTTPCPAQIPIGESCSAPGNLCTYDGGGCDVSFSCLDGTWVFDESATTCETTCGAGPEGGYCPMVGESCYFGGDCGGEQWDCMEDHHWGITYYDEMCCNSPIYECPLAQPAEWDYCDPCSDVQTCEYAVATPCGEQTLQWACGDDLAWHAGAPPACDCGAHQTIEACEADPACRYLSPGCDAPTLGDAFCYPKVDCTADLPCLPGSMCVTVNANDCGLDPCVNCISVSLCL